MERIEISNDKAWMVNFPDVMNEFFKSHLIDGKQYKWLGNVEIDGNGIYLMVVRV